MPPRVPEHIKQHEPFEEPLQKNPKVVIVNCNQNEDGVLEGIRRNALGGSLKLLI